MNKMFEHSVKVPRHFKVAANIVQKVFEEGGSVKTLLYDNKLKHFRTNVLYALINESIKHAVDITNMFESTGILVNEPRLDKWLARVLTAELIYGKKSLPGKSKPEQTILSYKERFEKYTAAQDNEKSKVVHRPRYVRINTNLLTTSDAIRAFQDEGYKFIRCTSGSYSDYLQQIQSLTEYDFTQDYHVKTIFVFAPGTKLHEHDLYLENKIILQDKATALPVHLLAAPPGSVVLDMCAAPGMKTTQLAAHLRNQGKVYAVERNEKRYETLCQKVEDTGSKCVQTILKDALEIKRGDLDDVEYILLDPSCSGSGMELSVHNYIDETRLAKLTSLQEKFLKHAMNSFPNAKRIVYSTCSIFPEENERVVTNVVKASRATWRVKNVKELLKDQWNNFGSGMYGSMGTRCLYAKPDCDYTTGFFLAVLDRDLKDNAGTLQDKDKINEHQTKMNQKLHDKNKQDKEENEVTTVQTKDDNNREKEQVTKKNKKKNNDIVSTVNMNHTTPVELSNDINEENNIPKIKRKKRNKVSEATELYENIYENTTTEEETKVNVEKVKLDIQADSKIIETAQKPSYVENNNEIEMPKKKKKKDKHNERETLENSSDILVSTNTENNSTESYENNEIPKKIKKKRKNYESESLQSLNEATADVSSKIEQEISSKKLSKRKKQNETSISLENEKEQLDHSNDIKTVESNEYIDDTNNDEVNEVSKTKKKKHKKHKKDVENPHNNVIIDDGSSDNPKKSKKRKRDREIVNCDKSLCEQTQESDAVKIKKDKNVSGVVEITEISETCEVPKKKKRISENS